MNGHEKSELPRLEDPGVIPTNDILEQTLGDGYMAYEAFQEGLPGLEIEQEWQWYTPHKAWFARGQHFWTTSKGTYKEKTLYWLHVFDGYFDVAVWFKEKNRMEAMKADVSEKARQLIRDAILAVEKICIPARSFYHDTSSSSRLHTTVGMRRETFPCLTPKILTQEWHRYITQIFSIASIKRWARCLRSR